MVDKFYKKLLPAGIEWIVEISVQVSPWDRRTTGGRRKHSGGTETKKREFLINIINIFLTNLVDTYV